MGLDDGFGRAQQRRAAHFLGVQHPLELLQAAFDAQVAEFGDEVLEEHFLEQREQGLGHALGEFEHHVAHEPVADHHVGFAVHDVAGLDVARKVDAGVRLEQLVGFPVDGGALGVLGAVVDERHPGLRAAHDLLGIDAAHGAEGVEHLGPAFGVGAAVQQQEVLLGSRHRGGQGRALDAFEGAHDQAGGHVQRAGGPGRNEGVALAVLEHGQALDHAGIGLVAGRLDGVVVHVDDLGAGDDLKRGKVDLVCGRTVPQGLLVPQQRQGHAVAEFGRSLGRALQNTQRRVVAAHGVDQNFHTGSSFIHACMARCAVSDSAA